jgi:hypothetical protein
MSKTLTYFLLIVLVILLIVGFDRWWQRDQEVQPGNNEQYYKIVPLDIPAELTFAGEKVPLDMFYVSEALDRELSVNTYWHSSTLQIIKRSHRWFPVIDTILEKYGIPSDFKYLAVIESGLTNAVSPANAVGFWQFLKGTAKDFGLEVNHEVDERYHIEKSTEAACKYLLKSYEQYGNWTLVAASYNAGKNGINRLMEKQKARSYYDMLVAEETSRYIYRILAMKLIFENPESYGFYISKDQCYEPIPYHLIEVDGRVEDWADFAKDHGVSYKILKYFNPWLRQTYLKNREKKVYFIKIPEAPYNLTHEQLILKKNGLPTGAF